jgi:hypothetical protein
LGGEGGIGDCVGEGTGATEVHHIAEGHPRGDSKEDAREKVVKLVTGDGPSRIDWRRDPHTRRKLR